MGEERHVSGGVFDHGTHEEDGPGTWEALASPRHIPAARRAGDRLRRTTRLQGHVSSATRHRTSTCIEVGHWQGEPEPWLMGAGRRRAAYSILKFFSLAIRAVLIFQVLHSIRATHNHSVAFS